MKEYTFYEFSNGATIDMDNPWCFPFLPVVRDILSYSGDILSACGDSRASDVLQRARTAMLDSKTIAMRAYIDQVALKLAQKPHESR